MCLDLLYHKKKKLSIKTAHKSEKSVRKIKIHLAKQKEIEYIEYNINVKSIWLQLFSSRNHRF